MAKSSESLIMNAINQSKGGSAPTADSLDEENSSSPSPGVDSDTDSVVDQDEYDDSTEFQFGSDDTPTDPQPDATAEVSPSETTVEKPAGASSSKEFITVTDETGRRKKVEVDYSDKASIKKHIEMSYGARKWQADRDYQASLVRKAQEENSKLQGNWDLLNKAYTDKGIAGLVDLLAGREGAYSEHEKKLIDKHEFLKKASPEQVEQLRLREENERLSRLREQDLAENKKFREKMDQDRAAAEEAQLRGRVGPIFDKYRFAGKLGDEYDEALFDKMLWNTVSDNLKPYEERGLELTEEILDREFREVAETVRRRMQVSTEKKVAKAIEQKKKESTENVQSTIKSGYRNAGSREVQDLLNQGNTASLLKNFNKIGKYFQPK
jgi:hypothetical protein